MSGHVVSRKRFCRNPRGIYPNEFLGEFWWGILIFRVDCWGLLPWKKKQDEEIHPTVQIQISPCFFEFSVRPYHARRKSVSQVLFRRGMI